jgi:hypothetical protein
MLIDLLIDCDTCTAPEHACAGCMMTTLSPATAGRRRTRVRLDDAERLAVETLTRAGLVAPLRLVRALDATDVAVAASQAAVDGSSALSAGSSRDIA